MAIYHLSVKPVSRGGGRSATAASAYRAAELVHDHTSGETFDYSRKRGVEHAEVLALHGENVHPARAHRLAPAHPRDEGRSVRGAALGADAARLYRRMESESKL